MNPQIPFRAEKHHVVCQIQVVRGLGQEGSPECSVHLRAYVKMNSCSFARSNFFYNCSHLDSHHIVTAYPKKMVRVESKMLELHHFVWLDLDSVNSRKCWFWLCEEACSFHRGADTLNDVYISYNSTIIIHVLATVWTFNLCWSVEISKRKLIGKVRNCSRNRLPHCWSITCFYTLTHHLQRHISSV